MAFVADTLLSSKSTVTRMATHNYVQPNECLQNVSNLCQRCEALELRDKDLGGHVEASGVGDKYVSFGPTKALFIDYLLEDTSPGLPTLSASSSRGCAFCSALREELITFLQREALGAAEIVFHKLCYRFSTEPLEQETKPWLEALLVFFRVKDQDRETSHALRFEIQAEPTGTISSNVWSICTVLLT